MFWTACEEKPCSFLGDNQPPSTLSAQNNMFVSPLIHLPALTSCLRASPNGRQGRTFLTGSVSCPLPHAPSQDDYILVTAEPPAPAPPARSRHHLCCASTEAPEGVRLCAPWRGQAWAGTPRCSRGAEPQGAGSRGAQLGRARGNVGPEGGRPSASCLPCRYDEKVETGQGKPALSR